MDSQAILHRNHHAPRSSSTSSCTDKLVIMVIHPTVAKCTRSQPWTETSETENISAQSSLAGQEATGSGFWETSVTSRHPRDAPRNVPWLSAARGRCASMGQRGWPPLALGNSLILSSTDRLMITEMCVCTSPSLTLWFVCSPGLWVLHGIVWVGTFVLHCPWFGGIYLSSPSSACSFCSLPPCHNRPI